MDDQLPDQLDYRLFCPQEVLRFYVGKEVNHPIDTTPTCIMRGLESSVNAAFSIVSTVALPNGMNIDVAKGYLFGTPVEAFQVQPVTIQGIFTSNIFNNCEVSIRSQLLIEVVSILFEPITDHDLESNLMRLQSDFGDIKQFIGRKIEQKLIQNIHADKLPLRKLVKVDVDDTKWHIKLTLQDAFDYYQVAIPKKVKSLRSPRVDVGNISGLFNDDWGEDDQGRRMISVTVTLYF